METVTFYCDISETCHDFLSETFGSVRAGAAFILNALPSLLANTWEEILTSGRLAPDVVDSLLSRARQEEQIVINFSGIDLAQIFGPKWTKQLGTLSWFDRVATTFWLAQQLGDRPIAISPDTGATSRRVGMELHKEAIQTSRLFRQTGGSTNSGASFLLNSFIHWHHVTISSLSQEVLSLCSRVLCFESCSQPQLSGRILQDRLARLGGPELPIFTLACIEISNMEKRKQKKTVQASPKLTASVGDAFRDLFPNANAGFGYVLSSFPRMYQLTLDTEIRSTFCDTELQELYRKSQEVGIDLSNPQSAGDAILLVARQSSDDMAGKVNSLSPFARLCLEVYLRTEIKDA
ncbi:MAG: hypothetical protein M0O99_05620 [Desulfuromonas thiophila]|nr:hypothetical protein [Desulfuromonas thiophila]